MFLASTHEPEQKKILNLMRSTCLKMQEGFDILSQNIKTDAPGQIFMDGFLAWAEQIILKAN